MEHKTYKIIELVGTSTDSYDAAIKNAIEQASKSLFFSSIVFNSGSNITEFKYDIRIF